MNAVQKFRVVIMKNTDFDIKDNVYVYQLKYLYKNGRGKYKLVKQCKNIESATSYIAANTD